MSENTRVSLDGTSVKANDLSAYPRPMAGGRRGLKTKTLKKMLKKAGLKTTGKKATLRARCKKAHLMSQAGTEVLGKQETFAYAHADYIEVLEGIKQAVEQEEKYRWLMTAAQARIEVWRTTQYSARMETRATQ
jgi:hypothetical protein